MTKKIVTITIFFLICISFENGFQSKLTAAPVNTKNQNAIKKNKDKQKNSKKIKKIRDRKKRSFLKSILPQYKRRTKMTKRSSTIENFENEIDTSSLKESAHEDINNILVFLGEIPIKGDSPIIAPVFMTDQKKIFGSGTDLSFSWVGYKMTIKFTQNNFPFKNTSLHETLIGSFLYASGTNLGFIDSKFGTGTRFFTNYVSQIISLKWKMAKYFSSGLGIGSRQYFFVRRSTPYGFIMPKDHINIFPRISFNLGQLNEKGIDQLTEGILLSSWIGYGLRSRWQTWGTPDDPQSGTHARDFFIYSTTLMAGLLVGDSHNFIIKLKFKGGIDNDFISRPRFGGSIDNAKLDLIHGFAIDAFRVSRFGLMNISYGFNLADRLRFNLYFDYGRIFFPSYRHLAGFGYGFRIIAFFGMPIWITHGIGRELFSQSAGFHHTIVVMTAAGW